LETKFGSVSLDNEELIRDIHIILGILELKNKAILFGDKDAHGLIVPSRKTEFEIIKSDS
jgi:hypothetical protein